MARPVNPGLVAALALFHVAIITLANYTVQFTGVLFGYHFTWAMFIFPVVILATDLTVRLSGRMNARIIVALAYLPATLVSAWLADWRIGLASGAAYLVGQFLDIAVFQRVRERTAAWWPAPLLSTLLANVIDTWTFYSLAFHRSADAFMAAHWPQLAAVDLGFKVVVGIVLFLPVYGVLLKYLSARLRPAGAAPTA